MSIKRLAVEVSVQERLVGTVLSRGCSGPGGHQRFACPLSHDVLNGISGSRPSQSLPPLKIPSLEWEMVWNQQRICLLGKDVSYEIFQAACCV